ncbi:sialin-like isoform X2 [Cylas formicarius]|uniref:sialin-like isoform X2 n=1 Tax=Cylas formicarius TaxID=197179 RepID=UPI0029585DAA|nr:sialin-like isoform X2 [Cylas formicarius]
MTDSKVEKGQFQPKPRVKKFENWKIWNKRRIAIVAMAESRTQVLENGTEIDLGPEFNWSNEIKGYVLSSFFYGYISTQFLGGYFASRFGGKIIFGSGVAVTATLTLVTPIAAQTNVYLLLFVRIVEGVFEGVTYPSLHAMWAKWTPPLERNRLTTIAYSGSYVGNVVAMPLCAYLAEMWGWRAIFYFSGVMGLIWYALWMLITADSPEQDSKISETELQYIVESLKAANPEIETKRRVPWKQILTSKAVLAIAVTNFTENWGFYTLLTQLPMYLNDVYKFDLGKSGFLAGLPYLAMAIMVQLAGHISDWLSKKRLLSTIQIRKLFIVFGFLVQAVCMLTVAFWSNDTAAVTLLTISVGSGAFAFAGFVVNPLDIAPRFASIILGLSNTIGSLPGVISPILTGYILSETPAIQEWQIVFFIPSAIYLFGAIFYFVFGSAHLEKWAIQEEAPELMSDDSQVSENKF